MNLSFKIAQGKYILMISDDCLLLKGAVSSGLERLSEAEKRGRKLGGVAFYFRNWPDEAEYYVQKTLGGNLMVNHGLFLQEALQKAGWAEEEKYIFYKADSDLCLKMWQAGYEIIDSPASIVEHYLDPKEQVRQSNNAVMNQDRLTYLKSWEGIYYHPHKPDLRARINISYTDPEDTAARIFTPLQIN